MATPETKRRGPTPRAPFVEICVDDAAGVRAARAAGADRIELASSLGEGGLTPSAGLLAWAAAAGGDDLAVMIRPRRGDFVYGPLDVEVMERDIDAAREAGAGAVVLGLLRPDGTVDADRTKGLVERARPLAVTFHRAFDHSRDLGESLEVLVDLGVDRVLTSGGAASALDALATLRDLVRQAGERIAVIAGGGIRPENAKTLVEATGLREIHLSASRVRSHGTGHSPGARRVPLAGPPLADDERRETDEAAIRATIAAVRSA